MLRKNKIKLEDIPIYKRGERWFYSFLIINILIMIFFYIITNFKIL